MVTARLIQKHRVIFDQLGVFFLPGRVRTPLQSRRADGYPADAESLPDSSGGYTPCRPARNDIRAAHGVSHCLQSLSHIVLSRVALLLCESLLFHRFIHGFHAVHHRLIPCCSFL